MLGSPSRTGSDTCQHMRADGLTLPLTNVTRHPELLLTPGDFAVVRHKAELLGEVRPSVLAGWLAEELAAKGEARNPVGFRPVAEATLPGVRLRDAA